MRDSKIPWLDGGEGVPTVGQTGAMGLSGLLPIDRCIDPFIPMCEPGRVRLHCARTHVRARSNATNLAIVLCCTRGLGDVAAAITDVLPRPITLGTAA